MGTNYYRIPTEEEMLKKQQVLIQQVTSMDMSAENLERGMKYISPTKDWSWYTPWDMFIKDSNIHLGKRSSGWKFCWNFHDKKYYSNKEELLEFIRSGRIVDEYGTEWFVEEFIQMALSWGEPDGWVVNQDYRKEQRMKGMGSFFDDPKYDDSIIDGLRVSSATDFC
jgi:hypothetical protein